MYKGCDCQSKSIWIHLLIKYFCDCDNSMCTNSIRIVIFWLKALLTFPSAFLTQSNKCKSPYCLIVSFSLSLSLLYFYFYFFETSTELSSSGSGGACQESSTRQLSCPYILPKVSVLDCCQKWGIGWNGPLFCPQTAIFNYCSATKMAVCLNYFAYLSVIYYLKVNICMKIIFREVWTTSITFS